MSPGGNDEGMPGNVGRPNEPLCPAAPPSVVEASAPASRGFVCGGAVAVGGAAVGGTVGITGTTGTVGEGCGGAEAMGAVVSGGGVRGVSLPETEWPPVSAMTSTTASPPSSAASNASNPSGAPPRLGRGAVGCGIDGAA